MITPYRTSRTGTAVPDSPEVIVSVRRGGNNRLSLLAMMVPLLLLTGIGLVGILRHWTSRPPVPGSMAKARIEAIVLNLAEQLTNANPEILASNVQTAYFTHHKNPLSEWSVICRTGDDHYLFRVNGRSGKVFAINRLDDISGQAPYLKNPNTTLEAGITPSFIPRLDSAMRKKRDSRIKQAAESAARYYLPTLGLSLRDVYQAPIESELYLYVAEGEGVAWTFTYFLKTDPNPKKAIRLSVNSATGKLESFWNPRFAQ